MESPMMCDQTVRLTLREATAAAMTTSTMNSRGKGGNFL